MTAKTIIRKPMSMVITLPDPDDAQVTHHVHQGGIFEWRSEAPNYPKFEVIFAGPNPYNTKIDATFSGTATKPAVIRLGKTGEYTYKIRHTHHDGHTYESPISAFHVVPCPKGCPPVGLGM